MKTFKLQMAFAALALGFAVSSPINAGNNINVTNSFDSGNIAVVVDNGSIVLPAIPDTPLDLTSGTMLTFTPVIVGSVQTGYQVKRDTGQTLLPFSTISSLWLDGAGGGGPPDDGYSEVPLSTPLSYFGISYNSIFVTSDGAVTFGAGDGSSTARNYLRLVYGPPMIAPLLTDLAPNSDKPTGDVGYDAARCKGKVYAEDQGTKILVTWNGVPQFTRTADTNFPNPCNNASLPTNTFQVVLYRTTGVIEMRYGTLDNAFIGGSEANREATVGVAKGAGAIPFNVVDYSTIGTSPVSLDAGAIFQEFTRQRVELIDRVQLAREFYKTHPDKFNILAVASNFRGALAGPAVQPKISTTGLGYQNTIRVRDDSAQYGSAGKLRQIAGLGNLQTWVDWNVQEMMHPKLVKKACFTTDKVIPATDFLNAYLCKPEFNNQSSLEPYGFVDDSWQGHGLSRDWYEALFITPDTSTDPLQLVIGKDYSSASRMAAFASGIIGYYSTSLRAGQNATRRTDLRLNVGTNFNFFYNNKVPSNQFPDGIPRVGATGSHGSVIVQVGLADDPISHTKKVVDINMPERTIADPVGAVSQAITQCTAMGLATFMTERNYFIDGYSELEQYIMGLRNPNNIADSFTVSPAVSPFLKDGANNPVRLDAFVLQDFPVSFRRMAPLDDLTYCGTRQNLNILTDMLGNASSSFSNGLNGQYSGKRAPAIGDEQDAYANGGPISGGVSTPLCAISQASTPGRDQAKCVDVKTIAYILVVRPNTTLMDKDLQLLDNHRQAWDIYGNGPAVAGIGARGCQSGYSGVTNQCYDPFIGGLVPVDTNKGSTADFIPKFDTRLNPPIF